MAEHIEETNADNLVSTLTNASDLILFSAAIPYQSGQYHVNEQWPSYWQKKFADRGYQLFDTVRGTFWNIDMTEFWYKQNIFFAVKETAISRYEFLGGKQSNELLNVVHPDLFVKNSRLLQQIQKGQMPLSFYFKMLAKAVAVKVGFVKQKS